MEQGKKFVNEEVTAFYSLFLKNKKLVNKQGLIDSKKFYRYIRLCWIKLYKQYEKSKKQGR